MIKLFSTIMTTAFCTVSFAQMDMKGMKMSSKKDTTKKVQTIYTCVMHPEIKMNKPGKCPKCGMTLVKKIITISKPQKQPTKRLSMQMSKDSLPGKKESIDMKMPEEKNKNSTNEVSKMNGHDMANMNMDTTKPASSEDKTMKMDMPMDEGMKDDKEMSMGNMSDPFSLNLPMKRHGSGTGWLPDASPMYGYMKHTQKWMFMLHGNIFLRYNKQDVFNKGSRGSEKFDAPNWLMFMGQTKVGEKNQFHFSTMLSLDPLTVGGAGYPLLFQSGESYNGKAIVDRQHPHDLFSELSVSYSHAFSKKTDAFIYFGYPGEPALGPIAFMHRPAALYNPDAPLSHHWSDATHITFGVATLAIRFSDIKLDGSLFTGREPNAMRYDLDKPKFDSWSGRISYNPSGNWAFQISHGFIKSPEELHPSEDINRTTASAIFSDSGLNISGVFGSNKIKGSSAEKSFLLEVSRTFKRTTLYSRYEYVEKSVDELALDENVYGHGTAFPVNVFTLGINYDVLQMAKTKVAAGTQFSIYHADNKLNSLYGKDPIAFEVYLRVYPAKMKM